jgi:hypothetical protein
LSSRARGCPRRSRSIGGVSAISPNTTSSATHPVHSRSSGVFHPFFALSTTQPTMTKLEQRAAA